MKVSKLCDGVSMGAQLAAVCDPHVPPDLRPHDFYLKRKTKEKTTVARFQKISGKNFSE
jgi:hypothetical protein